MVLNQKFLVSDAINIIMRASTMIFTALWENNFFGNYLFEDSMTRHNVTKTMLQLSKQLSFL